VSCVCHRITTTLFGSRLFLVILSAALNLIINLNFQGTPEIKNIKTQNPKPATPSPHPKTQVSQWLRTV
jgi:hypothetical protein